MYARQDPFKEVGRLEKELKRSELYEDILKQLKTESLRMLARLDITSYCTRNNNYQALLLR